MKFLEDGRINCKVRIEGSYNGEFFIYTDNGPDGFGSQYIWPENGDDVLDAETEEEKIRLRTSAYWWEEGNMGCDCNRIEFLPPHLQAIHNGDCGHEITLYKIIPIEGDNLPILELQND